jgi:hypothetical protein
VQLSVLLIANLRTLRLVLRAPRVPFWELGGSRGYPPPPRISGIINLGENPKVIYGAQQLAGKILSRKELAPAAEFSRLPLSPWLVWAC